MALNFTDVKEKIIKPGLGITPPEVEAKKEVLEKRKENAKVWNIDGNKQRMVVGHGAIHYKDDPDDLEEQWKDIDLTLLPDKSCHSAPYNIQVYDNKIGFSYVSKREGRIDIELLEVGGIAVDNGRFNIVQDGNQLFWNNVADDINIKVMLRPKTIELFKQLTTNTASKSFRWKVTKWHNNDSHFSKAESGIDSKEPKVGNLEIIAEVSPLGTFSDRDTYYMSEEWTGRVSRVINQETRQKEWKTDPVFPVIIDAVVGQITAGADDGWEYENSTLFTAFSTWNIRTTPVLQVPALRFASVAVSQGANITTAKLILEMVDNYTAVPAKVFFSEVTNAGAFTQNDRPSQMTNKIPTAPVTQTITASYTSTQLDITSAIQTIVDQGGWVSGQGMRCAVEPQGGHALLYNYEKTSGPGLAPKLDITYSVGAPAGNPWYQYAQQQ